VDLPGLTRTATATPANRTTRTAKEPALKADPFAQLKLLDVQELDARLDQLRHQLGSLPEAKQLTELLAERAEVDAQTRDARIRVDDLTRDQRRSDADVEQVKTRRTRDQDRMDKGLVTNPKDLERMQHELVSLERLGVVDLPGVHHRLVALPAGLDLLDVGVGPLLLRGDVVDLHPEVAQGVVQGLATRRQLAELGRLGDGPQLVVQRVDPGVELLHVEQLELDERVGFQDGLLLLGAQARKVHGSVLVALTRTSTVSPSAETNRPRRTGSQVLSAAQCATSTSAGVPCSRSSEAGWCRRSEVR
jgi:hypothetical protein